MSTSLMNTSFNEHINNYPLALFWYTETIPAVLSKQSMHVLSSIFSGVPNPLKRVDESLSVSPYGSWIK